MGCTAHGLRTWRFGGLLALVVLGLAANAAWGQSPTVVRVEEDWEMVVAMPDMASDAPQVTCMISPSGAVEGLYAVFELNHRSLPSYQAGGLQLQIWNGETNILSRDGPITALMNTADETVTWTQAMSTNGSNLVFEILNGRSTTWGNFGGQGYLRGGISTTITDLSGYRPAVSVDNSSVGCAGNRVQSLVLKQVRYFGADGQVWVDAVPRIVHSQP
jgi:hypothetical protein